MDMQTAIKALQTAFEEYKSTNEERLKQAAQGAVDALTEQKLGKIDQTITDLQERISSAEAKGNRLNAGTAGNAETPEEKEHKAEFVRFLRKGESHNLLNLQVKGMSVGSDSDGGFLVPRQMGQTIQGKIYETSPIRQVATTLTVSVGDAIEFPVDNDEAGAGWVGETDSRTETGTPQLRMQSIRFHEVYAQPKVTQRLLDDAAVDIETWLSGKVADKISRMENAAFVSGDGVKRPRGFLTYADGTGGFGQIERVKTGNSGAWPASTPADKLYDIEAALKEPYRAGASFMMPRSVLTSIRKFKDSTGQYLWQPSLQAGQPQTLIGYPVITAEDMPAIAADSLSVAFGNFRTAYLIVDRLGIRMLRDPFTEKPHVKFYTTRRVGGDVVNFEAIKLLQFAV
jgi:HK97 family phage major capsid protein